MTVCTSHRYSRFLHGGVCYRLRAVYTGVYTGGPYTAVPMGSTYSHYDSQPVYTYRPTRAHDRCTAVYTVAYEPRTTYTGCVHSHVHDRIHGLCTAGRVTAGYGRVYTRPVYTYKRRDTAVYGPRKRPCTGSLHGPCNGRAYGPCKVCMCTRPLYGRVHSVYGPCARPCTCTRPCTSRVRPCRLP